MESSSRGLPIVRHVAVLEEVAVEPPAVELGIAANAGTVGVQYTNRSAHNAVNNSLRSMSKQSLRIVFTRLPTEQASAYEQKRGYARDAHHRQPQGENVACFRKGGA